MVEGSAKFSATVALASGDYKTRLMFNSYTVSLSSVWANLDISYSIFWVGSASEGGLDGSKFPAFVRINGYMTYNEKVNVKRFELFYRDIVPFLKDTTSSPSLSNNNEIYCASNLNVVCTNHLGTQFATLDTDVYAEKMISINVT